MSRSYNEYIPYDRTKLPRNKYGLITDTILGGNSSLYSQNSGNGNDVGGSFASLADFVGATATENGIRGAVPAPLAGQQNYFLQGTGAWERIPAYEWMSEFPTSEGLAKRGLQINGDFNVTDTLTCKNLTAENAHFWSLIIDEVKANSGQLIVSPSMFKIDYVGGVVEYNIYEQNSPLFQMLSARTDIYNILSVNNIETIRCRRVYQRNDDGERKTKNECNIGDMLRCRQFNISPDKYTNVANKDYWTFICNTDLDGKDEYGNDVEYTDEDGKTYSAFYVDLAFALVKSDGMTKIPLGTTLYLDGSEPSYPSGYEPITDTLRLKELSQYTWDGTSNVTPEEFENSEWSSIQESIIKIRGLDDQVGDITGKASSDKLYNNNRSLYTAKENLDIALYGTSTDNENGDVSVQSRAQMIVNGLPSSDNEEEPTGIELRQAQDATRAITSDVEDVDRNLIVDKKVFNKIPLAKDTITGRQFTVADDVIEYVEGQETYIYRKGDVIDPNSTINHDVNVIEFNEDIVVQKNEDGTIKDLTPEEEYVVENTTIESQTGIQRNANNFIDMIYSNKTEWLFGYVGYYPEFRIQKEDSLACLGHLYDNTRQNAIVISSTKPLDEELVSPAIGQYSHIDIFGKNISYFRQTAIAANGNEFIGSFLVNNNGTYLDVNEKINLFVEDIKTGLEKVGIHLDGDNSTITLVGSVDLRQHSQDSYDTLNLYDNLGVKRVEITPFDIPEKGSNESQIDSSKTVLTSMYDKKTIPYYYVSKNSWKNWSDGIWFHYTWVYEYTLKNYLLNMTTSANLGYLESGYELDLRELQVKLNVPVYLVGSVKPNNRGNYTTATDAQKFISVSYTLLRNGVAVPGLDSVNISNFIPSNENTDTMTLFVNELPNPQTTSRTFNNYIIPSTGTYSLRINVYARLYAWTQTGKDYSNPYYTVNATLSGNILTEVNRLQSQIGNYNGYKMTIGTNGIEIVNDNSKHFYIARDSFEIKWDNAYISMDDDRGLYIRQNVLEVGTSTQLPNTHEIIFCRLTGNSYTVTLPSPDDFGRFRTITILGWLHLSAELTVKAKSGSNIEFLTFYSTNVDEIKFSRDGLLQSVQLMATGTNTWRVISYV